MTLGSCNCYTDFVRNKEVRLSVRTSEATVSDLKTTARLRGLSVSSLVNMLVVKAIREEKALAPEEFERSGELSTETDSGVRRGQGDWREALENARGMWKDRDDLPEFFDELRKEWNRDVWDRDKE